MRCVGACKGRRWTSPLCKAESLADRDSSRNQDQLMGCARSEWMLGLLRKLCFFQFFSLGLVGIFHSRLCGQQFSCRQVFFTSSCAAENSFNSRIRIQKPEVKVCESKWWRLVEVAPKEYHRRPGSALRNQIRRRCRATLDGFQSSGSEVPFV